MSTSWKRTVKRAALGAMRAGGVYAMSRESAKRRSKLLILCYHGIALRDEVEWAGHLFVSAERFRERLRILRDLKANVLPLQEALQRLEQGTLPPRAVVITFDDGFYDFLVHAVPLLGEFQFPATLYLTTYYSGLRMPIINLAIDYLLWKGGETAVTFPEQGIVDRMPIDHWSTRGAVMQRLVAWCDAQGFSTAEKDGFARQLAQRFGVDYDGFLESRLLQIMTPDEAATVHRAGIDIQLHTHRHRTPADRDLFVREIRDNRSRIAEITGLEANHFCYPSGKYEAAFFPWLRECGVQSATTCVRGFAQAGVDPLLVPRVLDDSNMEALEFEGLVAGLFA